jgi:hypothetical protein
MQLTRFVISLAIALGLSACASSSKSQSAASAPANIQIPASVRALAVAPTPPANATKATTVGKGSLATSTTDGPGDTDFVWTGNIDVTGDGQIEETQFLWDDEDKLLYLAAATTFDCGDTPGEGAGGVLVVLEATGNTDKAPVGSGVWAVELDASECASQSAGIFGCDFDAYGNATACGAADLDEKTGELDIVGVGD